MLLADLSHNHTIDEAGLANVFYTKGENKRMVLSNLYHVTAQLCLPVQKLHRQYVHRQAWLCSNETSLPK